MHHIKFWANKAILVVLFSVLLPVISLAQFKKDTTKSIKYLILPTIFKTPETGWAYGLTGSISFKTTFKGDTTTRTSNIQALGIFTSKDQNVQVIDATVFFPKEKYILYTQISHSYYPDQFWGIGGNTQDSCKEPYVFEQFYFSPHLKRKIVDRLFVGLLYEYQNIFKVNYDKGGTFDNSYFYGKSPHQVSGLALTASYDTRNGAFWPSKGLFVETIFNTFDKNIGSDFNFIKWTVDVRYFHKLYKNTIVAVQLFSNVTYGSTPIRELAVLGGSGNMRGIFQGRFRDKNMASLLVEFRIPIYKRFSVCTFGDIGNVYNNIGYFVDSELKYSYGGGLRLALLKKEKLNLRLDYGYYNQRNNGFYLTVGECF